MANNIYPTKRQRETARKVILEGKSVSRAMVESGYSPKTAKNPQHLTRSRGWQELIGASLVDEKIVKEHSKLLKATKIRSYSFPLCEDDKTIKEIIEGFNGNRLLGVSHGPRTKTAYYSTPDNMARFKALETAYKLKGRLNPQPMQPERNEIDQMSHADLDDQMKRYKRGVRELQGMPEEVQKNLAKMEDEIKKIDKEFDIL